MAAERRIRVRRIPDCGFKLEAILKTVLENRLRRNRLFRKPLHSWSKPASEYLANSLLLEEGTPKTERKEQDKKPMINLNDIKITPRDQQVLRLLVQGCSNKEIAGHLSISPRTVKQHLRTLFLRAGIKEGRKRVKLATAMFIKEQASSCNPVNG